MVMKWAAILFKGLAGIAQDPDLQPNASGSPYG